MSQPRPDIDPASDAAAQPVMIVATVRVHSAMGDKFEAACARFIPRIRAENPGIITYRLGRCQVDADTNRMIECYADRAAMERHMTSALLREASAAMQDCIARVDVQPRDMMS
ncbi:MAG: antibiotic biosynthesis monooxygenase family protein [Novosphingobium sp.]